MGKPLTDHFLPLVRSLSFDFLVMQKNNRPLPENLDFYSTVCSLNSDCVSQPFKAQREQFLGFCLETRLYCVRNQSKKENRKFYKQLLR